MSKSAQLRFAVLSSMARGPMTDPFTGPNVERMTADPNVCFIEGDGVDGGTTTTPPEPKYTDADMQKAVQTRLSKETKKFEAQIAELQGKTAETETLKARLAELEEAAENAGKTATEQAQLKSQKELDKLRREIEDGKKLATEATARETQARTELRNDRAITKVMGALSSEKAVNADKAAKYALTDIAITHHDDGSMTATYGDAEDVSVADAVKAWLKDNDNFLPAPAGGAGTPPRAGGGRGAKSTADMNSDELAAEVSRQDALRGRR